MNDTRSFAVLVAGALLLIPGAWAASTSMNKCVNPAGRIEFTDQPCPSDSSGASTENRIHPKATAQHSQHFQSNAKGALGTGDLPSEDRLKSCDPNVSVVAALEILMNPVNLEEPLQVFQPALVLFQNGKKDEGVFWFYAAQLRVRQQLILENGDRAQLLAVMQMTMGGLINNYAFQDTSKLVQILDRVLAWDKKTPNPFVDRARAKKLDKQVDQVYAGLGELRSKLVREKASLEAAARQAAPEIQTMSAKMNNERCRKGRADPAYERASRKEEERLALGYVTNNASLIKLVGGSIKASLASSTAFSNDASKGRLDFAISSAMPLYAIVDVKRSAGKPMFHLACVTALPLGQREAGKDVCAQSTIPLPR